MQAKKQFHISAERRTFFDRKVLHYGSSRTIAVGKLIPKDWQYVRLSIVATGRNIVTVDMEKLYLGVDNARNTKANKTGGQDT